MRRRSQNLSANGTHASHIWVIYGFCNLLCHSFLLETRRSDHPTVFHARWLERRIWCKEVSLQDVIAGKKCLVQLSPESPNMGSPTENPSNTKSWVTFNGKRCKRWTRSLTANWIKSGQEIQRWRHFRSATPLPAGRNHLWSVLQRQTSLITHKRWGINERCIQSTYWKSTLYYPMVTLLALRGDTSHASFSRQEKSQEIGRVTLIKPFLETEVWLSNGHTTSLRRCHLSLISTSGLFSQR